MGHLGDFWRDAKEAIERNRNDPAIQARHRKTNQIIAGKIKQLRKLGFNVEHEFATPIATIIVDGKDVLRLDTWERSYWDVAKQERGRYKDLVEFTVEFFANLSRVTEGRQ